MGYSSVQIFGRTAAVNAFRNTDCINWALLQGRQLLFKYEGHDQAEGGNQLEALLKMISESSGSDAVYTLRWYERDELPEKKSAKPTAKPLPKFKVYENTPWDGSFNFKLFDSEGNEANPKTRGWAELQTMKDEFTEMKTLLKELIKEKNEQDSEGDKVSGITGFINGLMDVPEIKSAIAGKVVQLFNGVTDKIGSVMTGNKLPQLPAKIAGETDTQAAEPIQLNQDKVNKLNAALTILAKCDNELPEHLYKLAMIAQNDQNQYKFLVGLLNNVK